MIPKTAQSWLAVAGGVAGAGALLSAAMLTVLDQWGHVLVRDRDLPIDLVFYALVTTLVCAGVCAMCGTLAGRRFWRVWLVMFLVWVALLLIAVLLDIRLAQRDADNGMVGVRPAGSPALVIWRGSPFGALTEITALTQGRIQRGSGVVTSRSPGSRNGTEEATSAHIGSPDRPPLTGRWPDHGAL